MKNVFAAIVLGFASLVHASDDVDHTQWKSYDLNGERMVEGVDRSGVMIAGDELVVGFVMTTNALAPSAINAGLVIYCETCDIQTQYELGTLTITTDQTKTTFQLATTSSKHFLAVADLAKLRSTMNNLVASSSNTVTITVDHPQYHNTTTYPMDGFDEATNYMLSYISSISQ